MAWGALTWTSMTLVSYLIGGIPTAYVATRLLTGRDIRRLGDRNPGAANVYRNVGHAAGLAVAAIDISKGAAAILLVKGLTDSTGLEMLAGVAVLAGHNWPVHLGLRGGRGAATVVGVLLAMLPYVAIPTCILALIFLYVSKPKRTTPCLALLFISISVLAWPAGYSYWLAAYSVGLAVLVGLSHYLSIHLPAYGGPPELKTERAPPQG